MHRQYIDLSHEQGGTARLIDTQTGWAPGCYRVDVENLKRVSTDLTNTIHHDVMISRASCGEACEAADDDRRLRAVGDVRAGRGRGRVARHGRDGRTSDLSWGYYVGKFDCVVLDRVDDQGWLRHELDCETLGWYTQEP